MNRRRLLFMAAGAALLVACTPSAHASARASAPPGALPNGLYRIVSESSTREGSSLHYDPRLADPGSKEPARWVTIDETDYVPLVLGRPPTAVTQEDGKLLLEIALAPEHVATLEGFTERNVGGRGAVVLDKEIVSVHKQRSVIRGGRMQITRCTDRACQKLVTKLTAEDAGS